MPVEQRKCRFCGETNQTSLVGMAQVECSSDSMCRHRILTQLTAAKAEIGKLREFISGLREWHCLECGGEIGDRGCSICVDMDDEIAALLPTSKTVPSPAGEQEQGE